MLTPDKFQALLKVVFKMLYEYIELNPTDQYSRICQEWFNNGLTITNSPQDLYKICNISNLEDWYYLLRISPATKGHLILNWTHDAITYETTQPVDTVETELLWTPPSTPAQLITDVPSWQTFHRTIYPSILDWLQGPTQGHIAYAWKAAINSGITINSTWTDLKQAMNITSFRDYHHYIANCPNITKKVKLQLDNNTGVIYYRHIEIQPLLSLL